MVCIIYNLILTNTSHFIFTCFTFIIIVIKYFSARTDPDNGTNETSKNVDEEPEIDRIRPLAGTSQEPQLSQDMGDQLILAHK